jgi:arylsulfatase A-like enzyme
VRTVQVGRHLDLIGRFPRASVQTLDERERPAGRVEPLEGNEGVDVGEAAIGGASRPGFMEHPECSLVFQDISLPASARLVTGFGVAEGAWDKPGDGVTFRLGVAPHGRDRERVQLLERYIDPKSDAEDRHWFDVDLDLTPWSGQSVDVYFETDGGPEGNTDYDWAFWSTPRILEAGDKDDEPVFDFVDSFERAGRYRVLAPRTVHLHEVSIGEDLRPVIFQHPSSMVRYTGLSILPGARLCFGVALDPTVWDKEGDGADFKIWAECGGKRTQLYERYIDPKNREEDRCWFDEELSLEEFAGQEITLDLVTGPGPEGDDRYDWALWSAPAIRSPGRRLRLAEEDDPNFLLITVDTLRADHLGCYGHPTVRTPHMDGLAQRGIRFANARCQSNITIPSHVAILSGRYPHHHILDNRRHHLDAEVRTLGEILQEAGYRTFAATSVHILGPDWTEGLDRGFDDFDSVKQARRIGERTAAVFHEWLEAHHQEPFFAWLHLFDPHAPYLPTRPFHRMYYQGNERDPAGPGLGSMDFPRFMNKNVEWLEGITDPAFPATQYAAQVSHADSVVGNVLESLQGFGLDQRTMVALTADHGESLGEHGLHFDHFGLHDEVARVPLIFALPPIWMRRGGHALSQRSTFRPSTWNAEKLYRDREVTADVMTVDIVPTVLDLAGLPAPENLDGRSLVPVLQREQRSVHEFTAAEHTNLAQLMVVRDGWKYLRTAQTMEYTSSFSLKQGEELLFHLDEDPGELRPQDGQGGQRLAQLRGHADALLEAAAGAGRKDRSLEMDEVMKNRLRDLGYL